MKKLLSYLRLLPFGLLLFLINCTVGDDVTKETLCGVDIQVKKYACNAGTCYFVVSSDASVDFKVNVLLEAKDPSVEDLNLSFLSTTLTPSYSTTEGDLLPFGIWEQGFGYNSSTPSFYQSSIIGTGTFYNTALYEYPSFVVELVSECPDEEKHINSDEVEETAAIFVPSTLVVSSLSAGDDLRVDLYSNNPQTTIDVTITTSLDETETLTLSRTSPSQNFYVGTISSELSNTKGEDGDGEIHVESGTTITVTYTGGLDQNGNSSDISLTITASGDLAPTCSDGIQNGDEEDVDCGGSNCDACVSCSDGMQNGDETGIDCGGTDCEACVVTGLTFESVTYEINDASYLDYTANGKSYILFTISRYENEEQVFSANIEIVSSTSITTETYTFGDADFGVTGSVAVDNVPDYATVTGGFVVLVVTPTGDYAMELDLMTDKGALTGSHTVPSGF